MRLSAEQVLKRAEKARAKKNEWRDQLEEAYEYALPQRNLYDAYDGGVTGKNKMKKVYDSTAINSTQRFANRLQSTLFPPYRHWCQLVAGTDIPLEQREELNLALDLYTEQFFAVLRQSNFDLAMSEFLLDLAVGTAVMLIQPGDENMPVKFEAVPQFLVALDGDKNGTVTNVYRKMRINAESLKTQWPDIEIPPALADLIRDEPTEEIELLEATIYRPEENYYCYHVIWEKTRDELVYRESWSSSWIVARWCTAAGEKWGRGPLLTALPDIVSLNATKRMLLQKASMDISGMYTVADDGVMNPENISIQPGLLIPVARNGGPQGPSIAALPRSGDINLAQMVINDLTVNIKKIMLDDTLPPDTMSARSATEVQARMSELVSNIGAAYGRLITEAMIPIVARVLHVMDMANIINLDSLEIDGRQVKVTPVSPLAKAQSQDELNSLMQYMQVLQGYGPAGMIAVNQEKALAFIADRLGVPARLLTTKEERATLMAQMQEAMAAQAQPAEAEAEAPAA